jgi:hypothetical protein
MVEDKDLIPLDFPEEKITLTKPLFSLVVIFLAQRFVGLSLTDLDEDDYGEKYDKLIANFTDLGWKCLRKSVKRNSTR